MAVSMVTNVGFPDSSYLRPNHDVRASSSVATLGDEAANVLAKAAHDRLKQEDEFRAAYRALGSRRGLRASATGRQIFASRWVNQGRQAAKWLADRIRAEQDSDLALAAAEVLAAFGELAVDVLLEILENDTLTNFNALALIDALAWTGPEVRAAQQARIRALVLRATESTIPMEIRCGGVRAARSLPTPLANELLRSLDDSGSTVLRTEIDEVFSELDP